MIASHNNATTSTVIQKVSLWQGLLYSIHEKLYLIMWSIFSVLWVFIWKDLTPVYCSSIYFACHLSILFRSLKQIFMYSGSTNWCYILHMLLWLTRSCSTCIKRYLYFTNGKVISLPTKARYEQPFFFFFWMPAQFNLKKENIPTIL